VAAASGIWRAGSRRSRSRTTSSIRVPSNASVLVLRTDDLRRARGFQNVCRPSVGSRVVEGAGTLCAAASPCPFPTGGATAFDGRTRSCPEEGVSSRSTTFVTDDIKPQRLGLRSVCGVRGSTSTDDAAAPAPNASSRPLPSSTPGRSQSLRTGGGTPCRLPVNLGSSRKKAICRAVPHVHRDAPQLRIAGPVTRPRPKAGFRRPGLRDVPDIDIYLRRCATAMARLGARQRDTGSRMAHAATRALPSDPGPGRWLRGIARQRLRSVVTWQPRRGGSDIPGIPQRPRGPRPGRQRADGLTASRTKLFVLPDVQQRFRRYALFPPPRAPERRRLMEIRSLTR